MEKLLNVENNNRFVEKNKYIRKKKSREEKYERKLLILLIIMNSVLTCINIEDFLKRKKEPNYNILSNVRKTEMMNVALSIRSYNQMSDYFKSKNNLNNGYQIVKEEKIVLPKKENLKYSKLKKIYIGYTDWNDKRAMEYIDYLESNLKDKFIFQLSQENPDYLLFSSYGFSHKNSQYDEAIKIGIYEEGFIPTFNEEDYIFGVSHIFYLDRYFRKSPLLYYLKDLKNRDFRKARFDVIKGKKRAKFCASFFKKEKNQDFFREKFIKELSKYKKVDIGRDINNIAENNLTESIKFLSSYKFSIAFEKNSIDGYATGNIISSLMAGTIPIYYGDYLIEEYINPDTYILVKNDIDLLDKIEFIKRIDQDDKLYKEILKKDVLIDENIVEKRKKEENEYWTHIFIQDKYDARRIDNNVYKTRKCNKK